MRYVSESNYNVPWWLYEHRADVYSQSGEDGIISQILARIPQRDNWCVEFGASDGITNSNVLNLIRNHRYSAVLIEPDKAAYNCLLHNFADKRDRVEIVNGDVGWDETNKLDTHLSNTEIPENFDLCVIDVDGTDYYVWEAVERYTPKVVCIEFNPTIATELIYIQEKDAQERTGSSLLALVVLANKKGYKLVSVTDFNAFFVKECYYSLYEIPNNSPLLLRRSAMVTYLFSGYDGKMHTAGCNILPWHFLKVRNKNVQVVPWFLRKFPGDMGLLRRGLLHLYCKYKQLGEKAHV